MAYSYKTSIAFGLVYIPITLYNTIKNNDIGFNMLDKKTKSRVKYKKTCEDCGDKTIKNEDIVKGYKVGDNDYVIFEEDELEKLKGKSDKNIIIEKFCALSDINPIYFDKTFYVVPENKGAEKAYYLLLSTLKDENKVGIAKTMLGSSECVVALWVKGSSLVLSRLFFDEEVQRNPAENITAEVSKQEKMLAKSIIEAMDGKFDPSEYKDEYAERVKKAIKDKAKGKEIKVIDNEKTVKITDLMEALQKSVNSLENKGSGKVVKIKKKAQMDLFDSKAISPMLLEVKKQPFEDRKSTRLNSSHDQ